MTPHRVDQGSPRRDLSVSRARTSLIVAALGCVALVLSGCGGGTKTDRGGLISVGTRTVAPAVRGTLLNGGSFDLAAHKGEVVVINFWASNCAPCRTEAPELDATYAATKADGVAFLGISVRDERDKALAYLAAIKAPYGSLFDPSGETALNFKVPPTTIPSTLVIDRVGRLASIFYGLVYQKQLEPVIRKLLAETS
jgi:thiol-disulfide isomerase/thioredoxin